MLRIKKAAIKLHGELLDRSNVVVETMLPVVVDVGNHIRKERSGKM